MSASVPDVAQEWAVRLPGLADLWAHTHGRPEIRIAILDGPVDPTAVKRQGLAPSSATSHGTHIQSIVAGSSDGVPGIAPGCTAFSIPIFDGDDDYGVALCSQPRLAAAIREAIAQRANVINISASQQVDLLSLNTDLSGAIHEAVAADSLVVAAAGNHGCACDTIPASVPGVLAVGAHDSHGIPLASSNWGVHQRTQGIVAPGLNVPGACVGGGLCRATGTSFAAAMVSAVAGLLMSIDLDRGRQPSGVRIRKILIESGVGPDESAGDIASRYLSGRLSVSRALERLLGEQSNTNNKGEGAYMTTNTEIEVAAMPPPSSAVAGLTPAEAKVAVVEPAQDKAATGLAPADCGCGGQPGACTCGQKAEQQQKTQLVYAIGRVGISFVSQARRDSIWRLVNGKTEGDLKPISDEALKALFDKNAYHAQSVVWTLSRSEVPMYAIVPTGAFAAQAYEWLVKEWSDEDVEFVSVPGVIAGHMHLYDGNEVDVLVPDLRGMYSWETKRYVKALTDARMHETASADAGQVEREINRFLGKIYFSIRNRGVGPEERALNAAATNAFNFSPVIVEAGQEGLTLRDIAVERSPLNRPGSEYYDVLLTFFNPKDRQGTAPLRARFTIDVSDTVPVMIGEPVIWYEY